MTLKAGDGVDGGTSDEKLPVIVLFMVLRKLTRLTVADMISAVLGILFTG